MTPRERGHPRLASLLGAASGLVLFLAFFLEPASYYGGVVGMMAAAFEYGVPVPREPGARALVALGMGAGAILVGALFVVGGALAGAAVRLVGAGARAPRRAAPLE